MGGFTRREITLSQSQNVSTMVHSSRFGTISWDTQLTLVQLSGGSVRLSSDDLFSLQVALGSKNYAGSPGFRFIRFSTLVIVSSFFVCLSTNCLRSSGRTWHSKYTIRILLHAGSVEGLYREALLMTLDNGFQWIPCRPMYSRRCFP
ncbi:hypothetical protein JAAARDRAFT_508012 [Jaapia argillacea MUCL 33604]|uniref:Uncharacterized protein n=1 Tax=Jaapia argillacea MUCL 33604 TaxID=933084 RepID=A0A067Q5G6_9AGAM|nr:hypothetical protein JAAARDRAFT_508012 [Jaapia argillacea MUCL 33604]